MQLHYYDAWLLVELEQIMQSHGALLCAHACGMHKPLCIVQCIVRARVYSGGVTNNCVTAKKLTMRDIVGSVQISFVVFVKEVLALTSHNLQRKLGPVVQLLR